MKLVIVSGFLGSGKTTLLLGLLKGLSSRNGLDFVILENEVGEIGIDGEYLERQGLLVKELYSGCICCQLAGDLVVTLRELQAAIDPHCVFLEASGLAKVESILDTVAKYAEEVDGVLVVTLADIERSELYLEEPIPFVINQLKHADLALLNKTDSDAEGLADEVVERMRELNPNAEVFRISALNGTNLEAVVERIHSWMLTTS